MADPRLARPLWRGRTNVDALTIACIEHAEQLGTHEHEVIKGSYQPAGDEDSSFTHVGGGVVDLAWCGHDTCVRHLREAGTAAWHRRPEQGAGRIHHVHVVVLDHPLLHQEAADQVTSYRAGDNGLAHPAADDGPRLHPIPRPVWPWPPEEDDMINDQDFEKLTRMVDERIRAATPAIVEALLEAPVDDDPVTSVRRALRRAAEV